MPANTPRSYPYPLPTEPVAEGAQAIRNLAERIDAVAGVDVIANLGPLTAPQASLQFNAIPQIYRDLRLVVESRATGTIGGGLAPLGMRFNGITAAQYNSEKLYHLGTAVSAGQDLNATFANVGGVIDSAAMAGTHVAPAEILIPGYRRPSGHRTWLFHANDMLPSGGGQQTHGGGLCWGLQAPITAITLLPVGLPAFDVPTRATLYGIF